MNDPYPCATKKAARQNPQEEILPFTCPAWMALGGEPYYCTVDHPHPLLGFEHRMADHKVTMHFGSPVEAKSQAATLRFDPPTWEDFR